MALTEAEKEARAVKRRQTAALKEEAQAHRRESKRREWREQGMYLTREEAAAGELCRGCGLPVIDNLGNWPPLMHLTDEEREAHDRAEERFRVLHPNCGESRWSVDGSRVTHCSLCCPPLPLSESQIETISRIFQSHKVREEELDVWSLALTCGHRAERSVHHTQHYWVGSTTHCPECGVTRGVVTSERILEAAQRKAELQRKTATELRRAERELAKAEKAAAAARSKVAALKAEQ